jgi:hypothetical protein
MESFHSVVQTLQKEAIMMAEREFECIQRQLVSLRRENRFLKVGLIFCLVLSALPYLTGFQPTVIRASKVVTERIEFIKAGKTVMSIVAHPKVNGLVIQDKNSLPAVEVCRIQDGGVLTVFNNAGKSVAIMAAQPDGGIFFANNKAGIPATVMSAVPDGGGLTVFNNAGKPVATMAAFAGCGSISLYDNKLHLLVSMDASPLGGRIAIKDRSGQTLWSAP